ncbi:MAG TPA: reverse transcriptase domain-containing protein [Candidatus Acidoferrum sp.]|nr:reverse transcriptase domain-containing protein [Candidatus Acidoferrum sp.]
MKASSFTTAALLGAAPKCRWRDLYREAELYKCAVRLYTKPLFSWRKALLTSTDKKDLYDFARRGPQNLAALHRSLQKESFSFRPGVALHRNFRGKKRTLYIYPWEERLVDLLLYRLLSARLHHRFSENSYAYRLRGFGLDRCQHKIAAHLAGASSPLFVIKRDISSYFPSVDQQLLLQQLQQVVEPDDYLFRLLYQRVCFQFEEKGTVQTSLRGIPFGTPIACFFANLYLTPLDRQLDSIPSLRYFRYADDLLFFSEQKEAVVEAISRFDALLAERRLSSKISHEQNLVLSRHAHHAEGFTATTSFRHLGLQFSAGGEIRLSRDKCRKICNIFRYAFRRRRAKFARILDYRKRAQFAVELARRALDDSVRNVAIIDYYLKHVTDESQLRLLDRWLAEEVLSIAFNGGHKKGYFRLLPFESLRAMGLPSLVHRRREIRHGQIEAPFFVWKRYQKQKSSRGTTARPFPPTAESPAFSPCPEAVTAHSSSEDPVGEGRHL